MLKQNILHDKKILITAGPTIEAIDPVRFISNYSSEKQGYCIADTFARLGAKVILVSGPVNLPCPPKVTLIKTISAIEMLEACLNSLPVDIAIFTAAVSDYRIKDLYHQKIKKTNLNPELNLTLIRNPDILKIISQNTINRPALVIGFAAETENLLKNAKTKLNAKGCDWVLANDVSEGKAFGSEENEIIFINKEKVEYWPMLNKKHIAERIIFKVIEYLNIDAENKVLL